MRNGLSLCRRVPSRSSGGWRLRLGVLAVIALASCASYQPTPYVNQREEGGPRGAFSGDRGEFVIYERSTEQAETGESAEE